MNTMKTLLAVLVAGLVSMPVLADDKDKKGNNECPVGLVSGKTLDDEFGPGTADRPGTQELTKCIKKRHKVKMVVQLNQGNGYGLGNITNIIDDYEITHGMVRGRDYEIVAVIHSAGGMMALKDKVSINALGAEVHRNASQDTIKTLMGKGVKFYFCQNTTRAYVRNGILPTYAGNADVSATAELIPGMLYTTAGLTSIADFQAQGYQYIQP
jgi:intracellular sulfur oxidation DsrE/DsrF family protein